MFSCLQMLHPRCPTCGKVLAALQLVFEDKVEALLRQKTKERSRSRVDKKQLSLRQTFEEMGVDRYCCIQRFMGYVNEDEILADRY